MVKACLKAIRAWWVHVVALGGVVTVVAGLLTHLDGMASTFIKYFGQDVGIPALEEAVNGFGASAQHGVELELAQTPGEQDPRNPVFDLYLKNNTADDVLLASVTFGSGYEGAEAVVGSTGTHQLLPDSQYEIRAHGSRGEAALSPPYLLKAMSRSALRVRFENYRPQDFASTVAFRIYDSTGKLAVSVNTAAP